MCSLVSNLSRALGWLRRGEPEAGEDDDEEDTEGAKLLQLLLLPLLLLLLLLLLLVPLLDGIHNLVRLLWNLPNYFTIHSPESCLLPDLRRVL